jgi:hypothetical protein
MAILKNTTIDDTGTLLLPVGTTAERPSDPEIGFIRYNVDTNEIEYWNGIDWNESLYVFSSFQFTNGGVVGRLGPSRTQLLNSYNTTTNSWLLNTDFYDVENGIQTWTVPSSSIYRIEVRGAQGGNASSTNANSTPIRTGGLGAIVRGDFFLRKGEKINILVGHRGMGYNTFLLGFNTPTDTTPPVTERAGGGGGSFVWKDGISPLLCAGGGGAASGDPGTGQNGINGTLSTSGTASVGGAGTGGRNGNGGISGNGQAGGGAGFFGDGISERLTFRVNSGRAIIRETEPGVGGFTGNNVDGGFGGGGGDQRINSSSTDSEGTGGGGGYSGGAGGNTTNDNAGGGGGSFISIAAQNPATSNGTWTNQALLDNEERPFCLGYNGPVSNLGSFNSGDGSVIITRL